MQWSRQMNYERFKILSMLIKNEEKKDWFYNVNYRYIKIKYIYKMSGVARC